MTTLAAYIWNLKDYGVPYTIRWSIFDRGKAYSPVTNTCRLCLLEKLHFTILYNLETAKIEKDGGSFIFCLYLFIMLLRVLLSRELEIVQRKN